MAGAKKSQASLDSFFKVVPPPVPVSRSPSSPPPRPDSPSSKATVVSSTPATLAPVSSNPSTGRIVRSSDDEDSDSDSSLVDLTTLFQANRPDTRPNASATRAAPSTPSAPRFANRDFEHNISPIVVPKYKFDLKFLASLTKKDDAIEASSKRVKALLKAREESDALFPPGTSSHEPKPTNLDLLGSVVAEREDGEIQRVTRAIERTEATLSELRWYFFHTQANPPKEERAPFPTKSVPKIWRTELLDPQSRYQTFVSGFAEDLVSYGKALPDEIVLWMLDELCREPSDPLRSSYSNTLRECSEQVHRLVGADAIQNLFRGLGGSHIGISVSQKIHPIPGLVDPYGKCEWGKLCAVVKFLGQVARHLQQDSRVYAMCMLLRMSVDRVVFDNVDILDLVHDTIHRLCRHVPDDAWEACCRDICRSLFESVEKATLRLQAVECIPSTSARTHDLRRRLAMCFYFNDISYSRKHSHHLMDLRLFLARLQDPTFDITPQADYRELTALVSLLDIAVDDARSIGIDLTDEEEAHHFDKDVDALAAAVKDLMKGIGNPGAAFISKIEAKEALELVAQRIADTLRSKPKPKDTVFDGPRGRGRDMEGERAGLQSFLSKMKKTAPSADGLPAS